jgi:hypothetical protein
LLSADILVTVGGEMNMVAALGETPENGFEVAEIREVATEEQDLH